jgi:carboxyl-terminal processing protease
MRFTKRIWPVVMLSGMILLGACKKEKGVENPPNNPNNPPPVSAADKVKDTSLMIAQEAYLWHTQIPSSFNPRGYGDPNEIMTAIRAYSKESGFVSAVDRWSFGMKQAEWDDVSSGVAKDFGLSVFFLEEGDLRVKLVEGNSPAGLAGIERGWQVMKLNGNSNITTGNADFIIERVFLSDATDFTFKKPDGSTVDITLNAATYQEDPIYLDTIYTVNGSKVGYLVFNSFLGDTTEVYNKFANIFGRFSQQNVDDVIIDLRYNGGGYVSVQEKLANYLANNAANGDIMMNQEFNSILSVFNNTTSYSKIGSLNLDRMFFIVSNSTASASELLINNLRPYMDVKVVGPQPSYGKPVGYFPIPVGDWYVFPVSFRTTNKNREGSYFNGIQTDKEVADGLNKNWGDKDEASLASILKYIGTGDFGFMPEIPGTKRGSTAYRDKSVRDGNSKLDAHTFKGAVDIRKF